MSIPAVSVIVPNYNHEKYLPQRLHSIFQQTFQDFDVILLDDCSNDRSREVLETYQKHPKVSKVILNDKNSGSPFLQWKKGVNLARGELIWIAESDDWADPLFLETLLPLLEASPQLGLAYCHSTITDEYGASTWDIREWLKDLDEHRWHHYFQNEGRQEIAKYLIHKNTIPNASGVIFRKRLFPKKSPAFQMRMKGDWVIWAKILSVSDVCYTPESLNFFRSSPTNTRKLDNFDKQLVSLKEELLVINYISSQAKVSDKVIQNRYTDCFKIWFLSNRWNRHNVLRPLVSVIDRKHIRPLLRAIVAEIKYFVTIDKNKLCKLKRRLKAQMK